MFYGVIQTRDILLHPRTLIAMQGFFGFMHLVIKCASFKHYHFIDFIG